jgi:hypothetical protein
MSDGNKSASAADVAKYCMDRLFKLANVTVVGGEFVLEDMANAIERYASLVRAQTIEECLRVPEVWPKEERDGMARAFEVADGKHGRYETLFAFAAWLLRHRRSAVDSHGSRTSG